MLLLLLGCSPASQETLLLTGWAYEWEELSHRVSYVRVGIEPDTSLRLGLIGGDWSTGEAFTDAPTYRVRYQRVSTAKADFAVATARVEVGPDGEADTEVTVVVPERGEVVALLDGFTLATDVPQSDDYPSDYNPAYGYTSTGFGFSLGGPTRSGDSVTVPVHARVGWAPQDREDVNRAIPYAVTGVEVRLLVVSFDGALDRQTISAARDYPYEPPYTDQEPMEAPVSFEGGPPEGFVGWTAFDLQANLEGPSAGEGDYLRAFGAELLPESDDRGAWGGAALGTLSTSSAIEFTQLTAGFEGELVRVGVKDATVEHFLVEGEHPVGLARTGPTSAE